MTNKCVAAKGDGLFLALWCLVALPVMAAESERHWVASWGTSRFTFLPFGGVPAPEPVSNQTLRQTLRLKVGGDQVRVRLSNELGKAPLVIGAATVALA